jgi:quercetin dioxygenase-like cupin family protein
MPDIPAILLQLAEAKADPALAPGARGARRVYVTKIRNGKEEPARRVAWAAADIRERCPVVETENIEIGTFTERATQERHWHKFATEIYILLEGSMCIEVDDTQYELTAGDMVVVNPGAVHSVRPRSGDQFLCRVVAANCHGEADKYPDPLGRAE